MIKSKRGRKPKNKIVEILDISNQPLTDKTISDKTISDKTITDISNVSLPKKRGRKPKGGKIIQNTSSSIKILDVVPNIILHLNSTVLDVKNFFKCNEIYSPEILDIKTYNEIDNKIFTPNYELLHTKNDNDNNDNNDNNINNNSNNINNINNINNNNSNNKALCITEEISNGNFFNDKKKCLSSCNESTNMCGITIKDNIIENKKSLTKIINEKLNELSYKLHNNISHGKSACFWCTYNFDTPNIYIPKTMNSDNVYVYGCFCSPECATAYLMNENLDISTKYERYYLLNNIYEKIYNYRKSIKPAPNPYYTLEKFCGNLTIDEYRNLSNEDNLIVIVNKPLTRIYPELFKDNNNSNISNITNSSYNINTYN